MEQFCSRWGCNKSATYDKPLCYEHWQEWESWELDECNRCHYYYSGDDFISQEVCGSDVLEEYPLMCDSCLDVTLFDDGKDRIWIAKEPERKPIIAHADIKRPIRYVYI